MKVSSMGTRGAVHRLVAALSAFAVALSVSIVGAAPASATGYNEVPGQFMLKVYSESLGRAPDALAWDNMQNSFLSTGCTQTAVANYVRGVLISAEFDSLYPVPDSSADHQVLAARTIALVRTALNREPSSTEIANGVSAQLATPTAAGWLAFVNSVLAAPEFASLVTNWICDMQSWERDPSAYYWNISSLAPAGNVVDSRCGLGNMTQSALQAVLNATPSGGTVRLAQGAIVTIDGAPVAGSPTGGLYIPPGVTLRTCGAADAAGLRDVGPTSYASMARFVRTWTAGSPRSTWIVTQPSSSAIDYGRTAMVRVDNGARLLNVWVDGQANVPDSYCEGCGNVMLLGGSGTEVSNSRVENGAGSAQLQTVGEWNRMLSNPAVVQSKACTGTNVVSGNLVTAYNSAHHRPATSSGSAGAPDATWTDGMNIGCEDTLVQGNTILDSTDVGLIVFRSCYQGELGYSVGASTKTAQCTSGPIAQKSQVLSNTIVNGGSSAYAALMLSPFDGDANTPMASYNGSRMEYNSTWTSVAAHYNVGIIAGVRVYTYANTARKASGADSSGNINATIRYNNTNGQLAYVGNSILVSGLLDFRIRDNATSLMITAAPGVGGVPATGYYSTPAQANWVCSTTAVNTPALMVAETYLGGTTPAFAWASGDIATSGTTPIADVNLSYTVGGSVIGCVLGGISNGL